jgi:PHD/YefM family antitoxin component YafN of YafNO toxin-antitoxin module
MRPEAEPIRHPLSELENHASEWTAELKASHQPIFLTVGDQPEIVMQDAVSYQQMLQRLDELETERAIEAGQRSLAAGQTIPLDEAMEHLRAEFDLRG